jgi:hypothetical protein
MTPEVQAYIDAKFTVNFYNQWAMIGALVGILVSKILIWRHLVWLVREQVSTHLEQSVTTRKQDETTRKLEEGTKTITQKVEEVPQRVAAIAAEVAASAGDGDLLRPPLPPPPA